MQRIEPIHYPPVRPLFNAPHLGFVVDAMIAGKSPAVIFVDNVAQPRSAFVWDKTHCVYLGGDADNPEFNARLAAVIEDDWRSHVEQLGMVKIYDTGPAWTEKLPELFAAFTLSRYERVLYAGDGQNAVPDWRDMLPAGYTMESINGEFLARPLAGIEGTIEEIESCWTSMAQFYTDGFGYCLVTDTGEIACRCTAEYVSKGTCGIGIETAEAYRRRGFATLTAAAFLDACRERQMKPHWDAWRSNTPSVAVAEKIGLRKVHDYAVQVAEIAEV